MPHEIENVTVGLCVLGTAFVVEGYSFWVALDECNLEAKKAGLTLREYLVQGVPARQPALRLQKSDEGFSVTHGPAGQAYRWFSN